MALGKRSTPAAVLVSNKAALDKFMDSNPVKAIELPSYSFTPFFRMLAKIAHSYTVAQIYGPQREDFPPEKYDLI